MTVTERYTTAEIGKSLKLPYMYFTDNTEARNPEDCPLADGHWNNAGITSRPV